MSSISSRVRALETINNASMISVSSSPDGVIDNVKGLLGYNKFDNSLWYGIGGNQWAEIASGSGGAGEVNIGDNVGAGAGLSYKDKTGVTLNFRSLQSLSSELDITTATNEINFNLDLSDYIKSATSLGSGIGVYQGEISQVLQFRSLTAQIGQPVFFTNDANEINVEYDMVRSALASQADLANDDYLLTQDAITKELRRAELFDISNPFGPATGVYEGCEITVNAGDNTLIDISAGIVVIVDSDGQPNNRPNYTIVEYAGITGTSTLYGSGEEVTTFGIASNGALVKIPGFPPDEDFRLQAILGSAVTFNSAVIDKVQNYPTPIFDTMQQLNDMWVIKGADIIGLSYLGADLVTTDIDRSEFDVGFLGINFHTNPKAPNLKSYPADGSHVFIYSYYDGANFIYDEGKTNLDVVKWNNIASGLVNLLNANKWKNDYIYYNVLYDLTFVVYGQVEYSSLGSALDGIIPDSQNLLLSDILQQSQLITVATINLNDVGADIIYTPISSSNSSGGNIGTSRFTGLVDTPSDYVGSSGYAVVVNGFESGLEFVAGGAGITEPPNDTYDYLRRGDSTWQTASVKIGGPLTAKLAGYTAINVDIDDAVNVGDYGWYRQGASRWFWRLFNDGETATDGEGSSLHLVSRNNDGSARNANVISFNREKSTMGIGIQTSHRRLQIQGVDGKPPSMDYNTSPTPKDILTLANNHNVNMSFYSEGGSGYGQQIQFKNATGNSNVGNIQAWVDENRVQVNAGIGGRTVLGVEGSSNAFEVNTSRSMVTGDFRVADPADITERMDFYVSSGASFINSYDSTSLAYMDLNIASNILKVKSRSNNVLQMDGIGTAAPYISWSNDGTRRAYLQTTSDNMYLGLDSSQSSLNIFDVAGATSRIALRKNARSNFTRSISVGTGYPTDAPAYGSVLFYNNSSAQVGDISVIDNSWLRLNNTSAQNIYTSRFIRADGGLVTGSLTGESGNVRYTGELKTTKSGLTYQGYICIPNSQGTDYRPTGFGAGTHYITVAGQQGIPSDARAVYVGISIYNLTAGASYRLYGWQTNSTWGNVFFTNTTIANSWISIPGIVFLDSLGRFRIDLSHASNQDFNVYMHCYFM